MNRTPVTSSNVASVGYDSSTMTLEVEFLDSGSIYQYFDVPETVHQEMMAASSIGGYLNSNIKNVYRYAKI